MAAEIAEKVIASLSLKAEEEPEEVQCCHGAEISAAKHKKGRKKLAGPGKSGAELSPYLSKKGRKGAELVQVWVFIKLSIFPALQTISINWFT
jgi:hypothetical protein